MEQEKTLEETKLEDVTGGRNTAELNTHYYPCPLCGGEVYFPLSNVAGVCNRCGQAFHYRNGELIPWEGVSI